MLYLVLSVKKLTTQEVNTTKIQPTHLVFGMENSRMTAVLDHVITQVPNILEMEPMAYHIIHCIHDRRTAPSSKFQGQGPTLLSTQGHLQNSGLPHSFLGPGIEIREPTILQVIYSKCSNISNTFLFLISNKLLVTCITRSGIANREYPDQTASSEAVWSGSWLFVFNTLGNIQ